MLFYYFIIDFFVVLFFFNVKYVVGDYVKIICVVIVGNLFFIIVYWIKFGNLGFG